MKTTPAICPTPKKPKILPWLAHKAGISETRAEILWLAAQHRAAQTVGEIDTPAYWAAAMDCLHELVAAESLREDLASFGWRRWGRLNRHAWRAPLQVLDALVLNMTRGWRLLVPLRTG